MFSRFSKKNLFSGRIPFIAKTILGGVGFTSGVASYGGYVYTRRDQVRFDAAQMAFRKDQEHLKEGVHAQFSSNLELLEYAEQLPSGIIPNPKEEAYTPSKSQELVVQGFTGGLLTLFRFPKLHQQLVNACGDALKHHLDDITNMGSKYTADRDLIRNALTLPDETLNERAEKLGKTLTEYKLMLDDRLEHAEKGYNAAQVFHADIQHRLDVHKDIVLRYPDAKRALTKLTKTDPQELAEITGLSEKQCLKILKAGIGSAMYGIGLITGQTVAGLSGQVISNTHLDEIVEVAEELGQHAINLVDYADSLKDNSLSPEQRAEIIKTIKEEYSANTRGMRAKELALMRSSLEESEYSQVLAHTLAYIQGPGKLLGNMNTAWVLGAAVPLMAEDIHSLHSLSPQCINPSHGQVASPPGEVVLSQEEAALSYGEVDITKRVPGAIDRVKHTALFGEGPWLAKDAESGKLDLEKTYRALENYSQKVRDRDIETFSKLGYSGDGDQ